MALNGSAARPPAATLDWYVERGFREIPERVAHAVDRAGRRRCLVPAACRLRHARDGRAAAAGNPLGRGGLSGGAARRLRSPPRPALRVADDPRRRRCFCATACRSFWASAPVSRCWPPRSAASPRRAAAAFTKGRSRTTWWRGCALSAACTRWRISPRSDRFMRRRYRPPMRDTRSMNARPTARALSR